MRPGGTCERTARCRGATPGRPCAPPRPAPAPWYSSSTWAAGGCSSPRNRPRPFRCGRAVREPRRHPQRRSARTLRAAAAASRPLQLLRPFEPGTSAVRARLGPGSRAAPRRRMSGAQPPRGPSHRRARTRELVSIMDCMVSGLPLLADTPVARFLHSPHGISASPPTASPGRCWRTAPAHGPWPRAGCARWRARGPSWASFPSSRALQKVPLPKSHYRPPHAPCPGRGRSTAVLDCRAAPAARQGPCTDRASAQTHSPLTAPRHAEPGGRTRATRDPQQGGHQQRAVCAKGRRARRGGAQGGRPLSAQARG